jgi:uncharacterized protein (DUF58 family)
MSRPIPSPAATPVRKRPALDFSLTGLVYCAMMMFMGLAAVNTQVNLLFAVFGLMIGVLLIAGVISRAVLRRLRVTRVLPEHAAVGEPVTLTYEFANTKRFWPSFSVTLSELDGSEAFVKQPCAYLLHAAARTAASVPTQVLPKRRGLHACDRFQLSTSFPFGFIKRAVDRRQHDTILVFPAIAKDDPQLLDACRSADRSGATMRPRRGGDDEFYGVKEFRSGENPRSIYWRRSARTGVLVAKEMTQVSPPKLLLIVDTFLAERSAPAHADVERTIAMAASLASHALGAGLMVGLYAWGGDRWLGVHPNRGKRHRVDLLAQLAQLPLNVTRDTQAALDASREFQQSAATPVLLTPRDIQLGHSDAARGNLMVLAAPSSQAAAWFTFAPGIDFSRAMPWEQQPSLEGAAAVASANGKQRVGATLIGVPAGPLAAVDTESTSNSARRTTNN